jgi:hypothetical protein
MNTMSRVNGIFNKDLAVRLVLIANNDAIVYLDAATDPYSAATTGAAGAWSGGSDYLNECDWELIDIGHLRATGGNAGCIGCVCVSPTIIPLGKGSATSPADGVPQGDTLILILLCMK